MRNKDLAQASAVSFKKFHKHLNIHMKKYPRPLNNEMDNWWQNYKICICADVASFSM